MQLKTNIGFKDQLIHMLVGLVICSLAFIGPQTVWGWLGAFVIFFGAWSYSPLYHLLGIDTSHTDDPRRHIHP